MLYKAKTIERKKLPSGAELINGVFVDVEGKETEATIWKTDSKGGVFPNFDTLAIGQEFEGNPWTNPTSGKTSIYPPKEKTAKGGGANMAKMMDKKNENIEHAQDRTSKNVKLASCNRGATEILVSMMGHDDTIASAWTSLWKQIRKDLFDMWDYDNVTPF